MYNMSNINVIDYTATEARAKLFEIINSVYYGKNEVRIIKNKRPMIRITKEKDLPDKKMDYFRLAGAMSESTASKIQNEIKSLKKLRTRSIDK